MRLVCLLAAVVFSLTISCTTKEQKQELLARQYCGTCHAYPEPALLSKDAWRTVMPQMAVRMGIDISKVLLLSEDEYPHVIKTLPAKPMISEADFEAIVNYYEQTAPNSLSVPEYEVREIDQFTVTELKVLNKLPTICMFQADTVGKKFWMSNRASMLYQLDYSFKLVDSMKIGSPASGIVFDSSGPMLSLMGIMNPNDQPAGSLIKLNNDKSVQQLVDSLKRPVSVNAADLNKDGREDVVVCEFGNYGGALTVFENVGDRYVKHNLSALPGARKVVIRDVNNDGLQDLLVMFSQGDEQVSLFTNAGNFRFRVTTLLRFPPVYGSDLFDIIDFNKDGHWDIVTANGDNADYSEIRKPYHGVRIFLNDGKNQFTESWFHQIDGCTNVMARDFDKDGDVDIAATSFFPDFGNHPERSVVYFENKDGKLEPHITPLAASGRWMLMEAADIDADGYTDVILAALDFESNGVPADLYKKWNENPVDLLVLKNRGKK